MNNKIKNKKEYDLLLTTGMFYELHPELSGNWETDKKLIFANRNYKENPYDLNKYGGLIKQ